MTQKLQKLIYKSHYRGTKEGDLMLSSFARNALLNCSENEVKSYEDLLEYADAEIYEWIVFPHRAPLHFFDIASRISEYHDLNKIESVE